LICYLSLENLFATLNIFLDEFSLFILLKNILFKFLSVVNPKTFLPLLASLLSLSNRNVYLIA